MDFVALDFETANSRPDSACQLAMVVVRGGEIVDEHCWLIRPPRLYFSPRNISIHGIKPDHVQRAPTMQQLWPQLQPLIDGQVLVAHNAGFDINVLVASLAAFDIACPFLEFSCTRAIARRAWPGRSRYGLKPLGSWLGIDFKHHDALEDSRCCALIALRAAQACDAHLASFGEFEKQLRISRGKYSLGRISGPKAIGRRPFLPSTPTLIPPQSSLQAGQPHRHGAPGLSIVVDSAPTAPIPFLRSRTTSRGSIDPLTIIDAAAGSQPLAGKTIVCLGTLRGLSLDETRLLIGALGGRLVSDIGPEVDFVVACGGVLLDDAQQMLSGAMEPNSPTIRVLSERQFLSLLPAGKAAVRW